MKEPRVPPHQIIRFDVHRQEPVTKLTLPSKNRTISTMNRFSIAILLATVACIQGFMIAPQTTTRVSALGLMSASENESIMKKAKDCYDGECSLDDVDELLHVLKEQQKELHSRVNQVKEVIKSLEKVNSEDERKVDEIRETVRAIFRVFQLGDKASGNDYPNLSRPTGWSGEVGDGPTTAYDALPPKRIKKSP